MEEGDQIIEDDVQEAEEEVEEGYPPLEPGQEKPRRKCCNQRLDELSTPPRRMFLALWNEHAYHLPKDKVNNLKQLLQQLYAMTPEETSKYFAELRTQAEAAAKRKRLKLKLRKFLLEKYHHKQKQRAYKLFKKLLKCGISYAAQHPVPPLVSIRLRYLSDIILEQLCDLRKVDTPNRACPDKLGAFLISVADWMAIAVERLYYAAQISINELTEQEKSKMEESTTYEGMGHPIASSTPKRISVDQTINAPETYQDLGHPAASSTPRKISLDESKVPKRYEDLEPPQGSSTPRKLSLEEVEVQTRTLSMTPPLYSIIEPDTTKKKSKGQPKPAVKVPHFTYSHLMTPLYTEAATALAKQHVELPPYGFAKLSKNFSKTVANESANASKLLEMSRKTKNKHCPKKCFQ